MKTFKLIIKGVLLYVTTLVTLLYMIGIDSIYDITDNPIAKWFYDNINMPTIHDFFNALGSQYHRDWAAADFVVARDTYNFVG